MSRQLESRKRGLFSIGGSVSLIRSCLSSIDFYYMSLFKVPVGMIERLEEMMRTFL